MEARQQERIVHAIADFQRGVDPDASFAVIYKTYFLAIKRYFRSRGRSEDDSLECTQETFILVFRNLGRYEHRDRFVGWLYAIARSVLLKSYRGAPPPRDSLDDEGRGHEGVVEDDPHTVLVGKDRQQAMHVAIGRLPRQLQRTMRLVSHGFSRKEIATLLRLSPETVKSHLARGRARLRQSLTTDQLTLLGLETTSGGEEPAHDRP